MEQITIEPEQRALMFDERLNQGFREVAHKSFLEVPELRSIVVVYDYFRGLNDEPSITHGLWLSASGDPNKSLDAVVGSLGASLQSVAHIMDELFQRHQGLHAQLTALSQAVLDKKKELAALVSL